MDGAPLQTARTIIEADGIGALFSGVLPRVLWLSAGGTVFFSSLEAARIFIASF
jgi:hypothetical protein